MYCKIVKVLVQAGFESHAFMRSGVLVGKYVSAHDVLKLRHSVKLRQLYEIDLGTVSPSQSSSFVAVLYAFRSFPSGIVSESYFWNSVTHTFRPRLLLFIFRTDPSCLPHRLHFD